MQNTSKTIYSHLHQTADVGDVEGVKNCLSSGLVATAQDDEGRTPLHYALRLPIVYTDDQKNHAIAIAHLLILSAPETLLIKDKAGDSPVHLMAANDAFLDLLQDALKRYPKLAKETNNDGVSPIHIAIARQQPKTQSYLLSQEGMRHLVDLNGNTLLHHAVMMNNANCVKELLDNSDHLNLKAENRAGQTALDLNLMNHLSLEIKSLLENSNEGQTCHRAF